MHPESEDLITFKSRYRAFKYRVMPFGITGGPATFQRYINNVLRDLLDITVIVFIDNILIYSEDPDLHK